MKTLASSVTLALSAFATGGLDPDLVLVLDVDDATAAERRSSDPDRLEREGDAFHHAVRAGYRDLAVQCGWVVVDGSGSPDEVAGRVLAVVDS